MNDEDTIIAMVDSNLQWEHIKPSEKAFAYKMKLNKQVSEEGKPVLRSDEILVRQVGESRNQIARYIRLTNLIPKILHMVDEGKIPFTIAVEISYLKEEEKPNQREQIKIRADTLADYFPDDFTPKQKVELSITVTASG